MMASENIEIDRAKQLRYCSRCVNQKKADDNETLCSLTEQKATFIDICLDYQLDEKAWKKKAAKENVSETKEKMQQLSEDVFAPLRRRQNLPAALLTGFCLSFLGTVVWTSLAVLFGYSLNFFALLIGLLVGLGIRRAGKGIEQVFGFSSAFFTSLCCLLVVFSQVVVVTAQGKGTRFFETLFLMDYANVLPDIFFSLSAIDSLFYAIATYIAYKIAFRTV